MECLKSTGITKKDGETEEESMYCPNCGKKIENPAAFCPKCGTKLNIKKPDTQHNTKESSGNFQGDGSKRNMKNKKPVFIAAAVVVAIILVSMIVNHRTTIDLNKYYEITLGGYEGKGTLSVTFDSDKFQKDYKNKLSVNKGKAKKWVKKQYGSDVEQGRTAYQNLCEMNAAEQISDILEYDGMTPSESYELSNGDVVTFTCNKENIDSIQTLYDVKIKLLKKYTVKDLEKMKAYDPFKDFDITFSGIDHRGTAEITQPDDEIGQRLDYSVDKNGYLSNGDKVTVVANDNSFTIETEYGKTLKRNSLEVEVKGLTEYISSTDQITDEVLDKMKNQAQDDLKAEFAKTSDQGSTLLNAEYIGNYFLNAKFEPTEEDDDYYYYYDSDDYDTSNNNMVYLCYKVDVENYAETQQALYDEVNTYYTYYCFSNLMSDEEGNVTVDCSSYSKPENEYTVTGPEGDYDDYSWTYWGYDTIEAMYNDCVRAKLDQYTTEESVEDVDTSSEPTKLKTLPSDAKEYNGHYYERVDISLTWEEAKSRCERKGGHLVTITDADENNWIVKNINPADDNYCWLGGEKNESGAWGWVTGEAWDYTSFAEGQPDFMNSAEYYLCTSSPANTWNDSDMEGNNWDPGWGYSRGISGYIIEWDSDPAA